MGTTNYTWNPLTDSVIEESDGSGNAIVTYTNEPTQFGPLVSENRGGTTSYYHFDALGSTRLTTNSAQAVVDKFTYDAWGNTVASTGTTPPPYLWCGSWGYQTDAVLGNIYVRARTYQPTVARWSSIDPLNIPQRLRHHNALLLLYGYVNNSPCRYADASGTDPTFWQDYTRYLWNPRDMDMDLQITRSLTLGVAAGAATTAAVIVAAPIVVAGGAGALTTIGVTSTTASTVALGGVSAGLFVLGTAGLASTSIDTYQAYVSADWNQFAYNLGTLGGGFLVGGVSARNMVDAMTGTPSASPTALATLLPNEWQLAFSFEGTLSFWSAEFWATAPTPLSGGVTAASVSGIRSLPGQLAQLAQIFADITNPAMLEIPTNLGDIGGPIPTD